MKHLIVGLALGLGVAAGQAEPEKLKPVDVQQLLERLEQLEKGASGRTASRMGTARTALASAVKSDTAAYDLYVKCVEKVQYEDADRSAQDFREWKRRNKDRMGESFQRALRHQINWLLLVVEVNMAPKDQIAHGEKAMAKLDQLLGDLGELGGREQDMLRRSVLESVFASAYGLAGIDLGKDWPYAPLKVAEAYDKFILPPLRTPKTTAKLRQAWLKRIDHEEQLAVPREEEENRVRSNTDSPAKLALFRADRRPELLWRMEVDLFKAGDERSAARRMVEHIEKFTGHKSERAWVAEFIALVDKEEESPTAANEGAATGG